MALLVQPRVRTLTWKCIFCIHPFVYSSCNDRRSALTLRTLIPPSGERLISSSAAAIKKAGAGAESRQKHNGSLLSTTQLLQVRSLEWSRKRQHLSHSASLFYSSWWFQFAFSGTANFKRGRSIVGTATSLKWLPFVVIIAAKEGSCVWCVYSGAFVWCFQGFGGPVKVLNYVISHDYWHQHSQWISVLICVQFNLVQGYLGGLFNISCIQFEVDWII